MQSDYRVSIPVDPFNHIRILGDEATQSTLLVFLLTGTVTVESSLPVSAPASSLGPSPEWRQLSLFSTTFALSLVGGCDPACEFEKIVAAVDRLSLKAGAVVRAQVAEGRWMSSSVRAPAVVLAIEEGVKDRRQRFEADGYGGYQLRTTLVYHVPRLNFMDRAIELCLDLWGDTPPLLSSGSSLAAAVGPSSTVDSYSVALQPATLTPASATAWTSSAAPGYSVECGTPHSTSLYGSTVAPALISPQLDPSPCSLSTISPVLVYNDAPASPPAPSSLDTAGSGPLGSRNMTATLSPPSRKRPAEGREMSPAGKRGTRKRTPLAPLPTSDWAGMVSPGSYLVW